MTLKVSDILKDALGLIGVIEIDETPSSSDMNLALRVANMMLGRWAAQRFILRSTTTITVPLTASKYIYTIAASGADVTAAKPISIFSAFKRDSGNVDDPVQVIDLSTYRQLEDRALSTGDVIYVAYDPGAAQQTVQTGTLYVYGIPSSSETLYVEADVCLTEFVNLTDNITFEPIYYEPLVYNLASRLFRYFNPPAAQLPPDIAVIANSSLSNIKTLNAPVLIAATDVPGGGGGYDIYSDC